MLRCDHSYSIGVLWICPYIFQVSVTNSHLLKHFLDEVFPSKGLCLTMALLKCMMFLCFQLVLIWDDSVILFVSVFLFVFSVDAFGSPKISPSEYSGGSMYLLIINQSFNQAMA